MSSSEQAGDGEALTSSGLPNKPAMKLAAITKGTRIHKRPLSRQVPMRPAPNLSIKEPLSDNNPLRNTRIIYVSASSPFMSIVKRALKLLEKAPRRAKGQSLNSRIAAESHGSANSAEKGERDADGKDDVVIVGTGRAIEKVLNVAAWLTRRRDLQVNLRTGSVSAVDDILPEDPTRAGDEDVDDSAGKEGGPFVEESARVRWLSSLEVGVRMR